VDVGTSSEFADRAQVPCASRVGRLGQRSESPPSSPLGILLRDTLQTVCPTDRKFTDLWRDSRCTTWTIGWCSQTVRKRSSYSKLVSLRGRNKKFECTVDKLQHYFCMNSLCKSPYVLLHRFHHGAHSRLPFVDYALALLRWHFRTAYLRLLIYNIPSAVLETAEGVLRPHRPHPSCSLSRVSFCSNIHRLPLYLWAAASTSAVHYRHHTRVRS
jgi:hypothetical protein